MNDDGMTGYPTTFLRMFGEHDDDTPRVDQVEIPLIQRDYAQGREDAQEQQAERGAPFEP